MATEPIRVIGESGTPGAVAILGANSHIARSLIRRFLSHPHRPLFLFTRNPEKAHAFLSSLDKDPHHKLNVEDGYESFAKHDYSLILNCVGVARKRPPSAPLYDYFALTEQYDNLILSYLQDGRSHALYVSFSSGAVYGPGFAEPAEESTCYPVQVNHISPQEYYGIARLHAEAKHRALPDLRIIDLRLFSYFSRDIDLTQGYFITELIQSLQEGSPFATGRSEFTRDYLHPDDLFDLINLCQREEQINCAMDACSAQPTRKSDILEYFQDTYGLQYTWSEEETASGPTGNRLHYYSNWRGGEGLSWEPAHASIDTLAAESKALLQSG